MRFKPQRASRNGWINSGVSPPCGFVAASVNLAMVSSTQGDGELIAHLAAVCTDLRNSEVVGIRWLSPANQARVVGDSLDVIPVTNPPRLGQVSLLLSIPFGRAEPAAA